MTPAMTHWAIMGNASSAVPRAWALFRPVLLRFARRLTEDSELRKDLVQEALIELWEIDPTRFDLRDPADYTYLRNALMNRMRNVWRAEVLRSIGDPDVMDWLKGNLVHATMS
ncbi:MAG: Sigma-70 region 2 [Gemmatimonadetes bacterium]|nr:Sigma-70 region 2 [Gemmatimonadota bacterium]